jgi:acyl-coenzyme A thioesterase 13
LNPADVLHGGVLSAMIDVALAMSGTYFAPPSPLMLELTLHLSTQFLSGAKRADDILYATSTRTGGGASVFFADGAAHTPNGRLIATAKGTFKRGRIPDAT